MTGELFLGDADHPARGNGAPREANLELDAHSRCDNTNETEVNTAKLEMVKCASVASTAFTYMVDPQNPNGASGTAQPIAMTTAVFRNNFG